jgi:hypothetical protein
MPSDVTLLAAGTRGDIQPVIAIGFGLYLAISAVDHISLAIHQPNRRKSHVHAV